MVHPWSLFFFWIHVFSRQTCVSVGRNGRRQENKISKENWLKLFSLSSFEGRKVKKLKNADKMDRVYPVIFWYADWHAYWKIAVGIPPTCFKACIVWNVAYTCFLFGQRFLFSSQPFFRPFFDFFLLSFISFTLSLWQAAFQSRSSLLFARFNHLSYFFRFPLCLMTWQ